MRFLKPKLYSDSGAGPQLHGGRCACGYTFFPFQTYGCEKCGRVGDALQPAMLAAEGELVSSARVLLHKDPSLKAPFVVVTVKLDAGPVVNSLLAQDTTEPLPSGQRMKAQWIEVSKTADGDPVFDLRFVVVH